MQKMISIVLTVLMLANSLGVTYAKLSCDNDELFSVLVLGENPLSCDMDIFTNTCENKKQEEHNCCESKYTNIKTDDNYTKTTFDVDLGNTFVFCLTTVFVLQNVVESPHLLHFNSNYYPPPLDENIPVFYQVFII